MRHADVFFICKPACRDSSGCVWIRFAIARANAAAAIDAVPECVMGRHFTELAKRCLDYCTDKLLPLAPSRCALATQTLTSAACSHK